MKSIKILAVLLCLALQTYGFDKCYVSPNQIIMDSQGILIQLDNNIYLNVNGVFHDQNGYYFSECGATWVCRWCGGMNELDASTCHICGESWGTGPEDYD